MGHKEPKYFSDFFVYRKKHHWFIIPTFIFYYQEETFVETGMYSPSFGLCFRWLTFMAGLSFQKNIYYKNGKQ